MAVLVANNEQSPTDDSFYGGSPYLAGMEAVTVTLTQRMILRSVELYLWVNDPADGWTPTGLTEAFIYSMYNGTPGVDATPGVSFAATGNDILVSSVVTGWNTFTFTGINAVTLAPGTHMIAFGGLNINGGLDGKGGNGVYVRRAQEKTGTNGSRYSGGYWYPVTESMWFRINGDVLPTASFNQSVTTGLTPLTVAFTDTSTETPTSWAWNFGDGGTSTAQNPSHEYTTGGLYTVTLTATNASGNDTIIKNALISAQAQIVAPTMEFDTTLGADSTVTQFDPPPPPELDWAALGKEDDKQYVYKVYEPDGTFVGIWRDEVKDALEFSQRINTPGTTTTVRLSRSPNTTREVRDALVDQDGNPIIDQDSNPIVTVGETSNSVGAGTDVELNYRVDVYVSYGGFEQLIDQDGNPIVDQDDNPIVVDYGAPSGVRVFTGYIMDYELTYGSDTGVTVTLASYGADLSNELVRSGATTTVSYGSQELATQLKSILDTNPGVITYNSDTIENTGASDASKFRLNTKLEAIESLYERSPSGWYWYASPADNFLYFKAASATADHTFIVGYHVKELNLKRSIEQLRNVVYFVGGETTPGTPATTVYKKYEDAPSVAAWRQGLHRITDRRYTVAASMQKRAEKEIGIYAGAVYTSTVEISSAKYDLESIRLGQMVKFRNTANDDVESILLQIVGIRYTPTLLTLDLGTLLDSAAKMEAQLEARVDNETYENIPDAPA